MALRVNEKGVANAKKLIKQGKVDLESEWSFDASDENKILGDGNWKEYEKWFLAIDTEANEETKARYKFPFGKNGKVYRRGIIAAKQRASQFGYENIFKVADELLQMIDEKFKESWLIEGNITRMIETEAKSGDEWEVVIISEGVSKTYPNFLYTADVLKSSVDKFEGVQVYAHSKGPHVEPSEKSVRDIVGWIDNVKFENGQVKGILHLLPSAGWLKENLKYAFEKGKLDLYELSIDAYGKWAKKNGQAIAMAIDKVSSVDVVFKGARGGKFVRLLNSELSNLNFEEGKMKEVILKLKEKYPELFEGINLEAEDINYEEIFENLFAKIKNTETNMKQAEVNEFEKLKAENEALKEIVMKMKLEEKLAKSKLSEKAKEAVRKKFSNITNFTEAEIESEIKNLEEIVSEYVKTSVPYISVGLDKREKVKLGLAGLFANLSLKPLTREEIKTEFGGIEPYRSLKEAYIDFTGDIYFRGEFREATLADWAYALGDAMNRQLQRDYGEMALDTWKEFVDIVPLSDFRKVQRIRIGGYTNLGSVSENTNYPVLNTPPEVKVEYSPTKRGGLFSVTWEMIRNDDLGAIKNAVRDMARAAAQTLHEFVYDFVNPAVNPVIYDGVALYHASHNNLLTAALSNSSLATARLQMKKQTRPGANKPLGLRLRYLLIPADLEQTAYEIVTASYGAYNETPTFLQSQGIKVITVDYWTDTNNWAAVADKRDIVGLEIGFLDGKQEPEFFVQDVQAGDWFIKDSLTYKVRHVYGGAILDYRAFQGAIVP